MLYVIGRGFQFAIVSWFRVRNSDFWRDVFGTGGAIAIWGVENFYIIYAPRSILCTLNRHPLQFLLSHAMNTLANLKKWIMDPESTPYDQFAKLVQYAAEHRCAPTIIQ